MTIATDANNPLGPPLLSAIGAVIVAVIAGGVALWSNRKSNRNAVEIQDFKSAVDRDLERLKAKLEHGQLNSSTQWNAEFNAYQTLWESFVPVRAQAIKIVDREGELPEIGIELGDVPEHLLVEKAKQLLKEYAKTTSKCMHAINVHAPFYAADIREAANEVYVLAHMVFRTNLAVFVARQKGQAPADQAKRQKELNDLIAGTDALEEMIRKRMNAVQVFDPVMP